MNQERASVCLVVASEANEKRMKNWFAGPSGWPSVYPRRPFTRSLIMSKRPCRRIL